VSPVDLNRSPNYVDLPAYKDTPSPHVPPTPSPDVEMSEEPDVEILWVRDLTLLELLELTHDGARVYLRPVLDRMWLRQEVADLCARYRVLAMNLEDEVLELFSSAQYRVRLWFVAALLLLIANISIFLLSCRLLCLPI